MAFTQITVTGTYRTADGAPAQGAVSFTPVVPMHNGNIVISAAVAGQLNSSGVVTVSLAATTDPGTTPLGGTYEVAEFLTNQPARPRYNIIVAHNGGQINLATVAPAVPGPAMNVYLTQTAADARYELIGAGEGPSTPADGSVTDAKVAVDAAIVLDKTADSTGSAGRLALTNAERTKLGGIAAGATVNSSDASLRDRTTHTGAQPVSTVTGLQALLDGKAAAAALTTLETTVAGKADLSAVPELARDTLAATLVAGANVTVTVDDSADTITIASTASGGGGGGDPGVTDHGDLTGLDDDDHPQYSRRAAGLALILGV